MRDGYILESEYVLVLVDKVDGRDLFLDNIP